MLMRVRIVTICLHCGLLWNINAQTGDYSWRFGSESNLL